MRKIRIDSSLEGKVNSFCKNLFSDRRFELPVVSLQNLTNDHNRNFDQNEREYIEKIIRDYEFIIRAKPSEIQRLIGEFENIILHNNLENEFCDLITTSMRYKEYRDREYLDFIKDMGINACVYCNAQLTIVIDIRTIDHGPRAGQFEREGKFEVDHYYPQSKYPFLCTSFYNLVPCCSNCNKAKSNTDTLFQLYSEDDDVDSFYFHIDEESLDRYQKSRMRNDLEIHLNSKDGELIRNHLEIFRIDEIYATQKDIAEEIIIKSEAYTRAYKENLVNVFQDLFPDKALISRLLIGNYDTPEDIHKRPLAKFIQDLSKQVGLIQ
ncbi:hypothetical protein HXX01_03060 [Candidatus Nomurabacteria bacterium]|nr:hypothetical protein [Candidatus Nomurabacteria bacterium]